MFDAQKGSGILEVLIATALLVMIFSGLLGVLQLGTKLATDNKGHTGAGALAQEEVEYIKSLPYASVGTIAGTPSGVLPDSEQVSINNVNYTRTIYIVYIDDPKDGLGASDNDGNPNDYKRIKVTVSWNAHGKTRSVVLYNDIAPLL